MGNNAVLTYNVREIDNGRFHPALLELRVDGTGQIQNSDNVITENPLQQVNFGDKYINDLTFDPGNTTVITGVASQSSGSGSISILFLGLLIFFGLAQSQVRKTSASRTLSSIS